MTLPNNAASEVFDPPLDPGIAAAVIMLRAGGVETFESCEGGPGHAYPEPTVRFYGEFYEGLRAAATAFVARDRFQVQELRRVWPVLDNELTGPYWELTFAPSRAGQSRDSTTECWRTPYRAADHRPLPGDFRARCCCRSCTCCHCDAPAGHSALRNATDSPSPCVNHPLRRAAGTAHSIRYRLPVIVSRVMRMLRSKTPDQSQARTSHE